MEKNPNIGKVSVVRNDLPIGYTWVIEFSACKLGHNAEDICNDGDLPLMVVTNLSLQGCGGPSIEVIELVTGSGAGSCPNLYAGLCSDVISVSGEFPIQHDVRNLDLGIEYYVQARYKTEYGYGRRTISSPLSVLTMHNAPSAPPPPHLIRSTATSIKIGWQTPSMNGGIPVSGYELWIDDLSGADGL